MLDSSKGLAELTKSKKNPTVQFIHESVRDFLRDEGLSNLEFGSIAPGPSHDVLKACCLNYVNIDLSSRLPHSQDLPQAKTHEASRLVEAISRSYPFLEYAVQNVFHHANIAAEHGILQEPFLAEFPTGTWILKNNVFEKHQVRRYSSSADRVYILAEHNWSKLLTTECSMGSPIVDSGQRYGHPLYAALIGGGDEAAFVLLTLDTSLRSDLDQKQVKGVPLLSFATKNGFLATVKLLLELGASVDYKDEDDKTPLCHAAESGHEGIVKILLEHKAETDLSDKDKRTPLSHASTPEVIRLLLKSGADPESRDSLGQTPLFHAVLSLSIPRIDLLLDSGAALESRDDRGRTALSCAAERHLGEETIKVLLDRGADKESRDYKGRTPLSVAVGRTPLSHGVQHLGHGTVKLLLDRGTDIESTDKSGKTPLFYASGNRYWTIPFWLLLDRGANVGSRDCSGGTVLHMASRYIGNEDLLLELVKIGADFEARDNDGRRPIDIARPTNFERVIAAFERAGAK
ncbi:uncharacterized protein APUU_20914A [Aspergillus puulaauensis]|uniref:Ankyrin repeat-containing domain protein n=1 Tax=Aspergillus puulaauensis TaxID=1220207 RepID=A0A7R7XFD6_9EURO|nr:uncharacterized protein APUU_20914A [Aspergillus puulaauensis]BCS20482.1 hypothetical protein APUU_20914A [Aspergillus puulaauensis]